MLWVDNLQQINLEFCIIINPTSLNPLIDQALFQYWQLHHISPTPDLMAMIDDRSLDEPPVRGCFQANLAAHQAIMRGNKDTARDYTSYLLDKGFYEPAFISFCEEYDLCRKP